MDTAQKALGAEVVSRQGRRLRPLRCSHCMEIWKENGKKSEDMPKALYSSDVSDGICPVCGNMFINFFVA